MKANKDERQNYSMQCLKLNQNEDRISLRTAILMCFQMQLELYDCMDKRGWGDSPIPGLANVTKMKILSIHPQPEPCCSWINIQSDYVTAWVLLIPLVKVFSPLRHVEGPTPGHWVGQRGRGSTDRLDRERETHREWRDHLSVDAVQDCKHVVCL